MQYITENMKQKTCFSQQKKENRIRRFFALLLAIGLLSGGISSCSGASDTTPPELSGVKDIEILAGEGISYRTGVRAYDDRDGEITFSVDSSAVDPNTPGVYTVIYSATDRAGNRTEKRATVTVRSRSRVSEEELWMAVDPKITGWGLQGESAEDVCDILYWHIKQMITYVSESDKGDWLGEAWRGLTEGEGDCFTYYAVTRAFFERLGIPYLTVQRTPGARETTHYWTMVNVGTESAPRWYHFDVCPHPAEHSLSIVLMTDADLAAYNQRLENYYAYDKSAYPSTPAE